MTTRFIRYFVCVIAALTACATHAQPVQGAGATFPSKVYEKWMGTFSQNTKISVNYKPEGSGAGIAQIRARKVDFGGTDSPLAPADLARDKLVQIPMLIGGVVPVINLPGIASNRLLLSGEVLADLMLGRISRWNDARLVALNPGLALPARQVVRIVRSEKSGTTEGVTNYLSLVSPDFKAQIGVNQLPLWPGEVKSVEGNDGVVRTLKSTDGAIAYVSYDRVLHDDLKAVRLINAAGLAVVASEGGFRAAVADSGLAREGVDTSSLVNQAAPQAWPITLASFILVDKEPGDPVKAGATLRFIYWCFMHGDELTRGTGFAPIPTFLQARLAARFSSIKSRNGVLPNYADF